MAKSYLFLANGCEECEALLVVDLLRRAGIDLVTVSLTDEKEILSAHNVPIRADITIAEVGQDADLLVLPGGLPGTEYLAESDALDKIIRDYHDAGKYLAAVCAGPSVYGRKGLLRGRKATCYPGFERYLQDAEYTADAVTVDGQFITANGLGACFVFPFKLIELLTDRQTAQDVADAVQFRGSLLP